MQKKNRFSGMKKYNYLVAVLMTAIGCYILFEASTYEIGQTAQKNPAVWPVFLAAALIALSVALAAETFFSHSQDLEETEIDWKSPGMKKVYIMFGLTAGFVVLLKVFGMLVALFVLNVAIEWLMGCRNRKMLVLFPAGLVVFVYLFFGVLMKITIPGPFWM